MLYFCAFFGILKNLGVKNKHIVYVVLLLLVELLLPEAAIAKSNNKHAKIDATQPHTQPYRVELGLQGGLGYYVGDATPHIFNNVRETYGGHLRYKFDKRWALQVKGLYHHIIGPAIDKNKNVIGKWENNMINLDVMGEFNFFRFGFQEYDRRVKPITPYIFLGAGVAFYKGEQTANYGKVAAYIPFGFGAKWKFAKRWQLQLAWQHNLYMADDLEVASNYGNTWGLNGSNILNFDLTSQLTLGIVFEFAQQRKVCPWCDDHIAKPKNQKHKIKDGLGK